MIAGRWLASAALVLAVSSGLTMALPAAAAEHTVHVVSDYKNLRMYFKPKILTVQPGDTVTWYNEVGEQHNVLTFPDGYPQGAQGFLSPDLTEKGQTWSHTFTVVGTYEYHCLPHLPMGMRGVVIVGRPSNEAEFHRPSRQEVAEYRDRLLEYFDEDEYQYKVRRQQQGELSPKPDALQSRPTATAATGPDMLAVSGICMAPRS